MIGGDVTITDVPVMEVLVKPGSSFDFPIILALIMLMFFVAIFANLIALFAYHNKTEKFGPQDH
jgi:hypothetical protein